MWIVHTESMKPTKCVHDVDAQRFMLSYLSDEILFSCDKQERRNLCSKLNELFLQRTQLRESWGIFPYFWASWSDSES